MTSTTKTPRASSKSEKATLNGPGKGKPKSSKDESFLIKEMMRSFNDEDILIHEKLLKLEERCIEISGNNLGKDADYSINVIRSICKEIGSLHFKINSNNPFPGYYSYKSKLIRNIDSIVFKIELLADKYFTESYKKYSFINLKNKCDSKDKLYQLADEWLSDRRTMVELVTSMVDEIQGLGITPNPVPVKEPKSGFSLMDLLG